MLLKQSVWDLVPNIFRHFDSSKFSELNEPVLATDYQYRKKKF